MRGKFITLEGGEGCGKSTQAERLCADLQARGIETVRTREPGGTVLGERIRSLLKDDASVDPPCGKSEVLLFLAARAQLAEEVVIPALEAGKWVVSDRFCDSTFAYQGYGRGFPLDRLRAANEFSCGGLMPDLTLLLDVPPDVAAGRMRSRESATGTHADRIEKAGSDFHRRIREGFLEMAAAEPERFAVIAADGTEDEVWSRISAAVAKFFPADAAVG